MPRGPSTRVHEIFSSNALEKKPVIDQDEQSTQQAHFLGKKNKLAPTPMGMKRFGAYKPKILNNESSEELTETNGGLQPVLNTTNFTKKSRRAPDAPADSSRVVLTKPKPFVIGDKDVPMVLSTVGDDASSAFVSGDQNRRAVNDLAQTVDDMHIYGSFIPNEDNMRQNQLKNAPSLDSFGHSETSTLISSKGERETLEFINYGLDQDSSSLHDDELALPPHSNRPVNTPANEVAQPLHHRSLSEENKVHKSIERSLSSDEPKEVYIPEPDYDEEEKTMMFSEEETSDGPDGRTAGRLAEGNRPRRFRKNNPALDMYAGEDLSRYLSDDEDEDASEGMFFEVNPNQNRRKLSTSPNKASTVREIRPTLSQKYSLFKQQPPSKRKGSSKEKQMKFNSVRSFSYADSKIGTQGRSAGKGFRQLGHSNDNEQFMSEDSYESFLRSRHGQAMPFPDSGDSGVDMADDFNQRKGDPIWKKFTLRLKNRKSRDFS